MKKFLYLAISGLLMLGCGTKQTPHVLYSPDGRIGVQFFISEGKPAYKVSFDGKTRIDTSFFGFDFKDQPAIGSNLAIEKAETSSLSETWEMPWGEQREVLNAYNELKVTLKETVKPGRTFSVDFKAYNDGIGFRFEFPEQDHLKDVVILDELTEFNLVGDPMVWWIPGDWDIYEYTYKTSRFSDIDAKKYYVEGDHLGQTYVPENAVNTPVTMKTDDGVYLSFHEADLTDYAGMTLKVDTQHLKMTSELVGNDSGIKVIQKTPFVTPWRTIQLADRAGDLIESRMILNLNNPNKLGDVPYVTPMKYVGIWWDMHLGTKTWNYASGNHGAMTAYAKALIDFASANNIGGLLVEGWNTGWESWTDPHMRDSIFDFVTPYPDYDLAEVVRYGKEKGVALIMHHETSAAANRYEQQLDTAFELMEKLGIHAVKTGYVGRIIPEGEYHHGQWMVNHYQHVLEQGARHRVAINAHEPIKPTGKRRTYPNAIAREGVRGQEYNAWSADGGNPPEHLPIVAFTRMLAGPIDFTPGVFNISLKPHKENNQVNTTLAQQLALYVVIYSPVQMACDLVQYYEGQPAFQFIRDVAVDWEQSKVLDGEIGDYVVIARQERGSDNWFAGGIADENGKAYTLSLDFLEEGTTYAARIYKDGENAHWKENPTAIDISEQKVKKGDRLQVDMKPGGGFAVSLIAE